MKETSIFMSGNSQAMRIPKDMRFNGEKVFIEKVGSITIILDESDPWASLKLAQTLISPDFMNEGRKINAIVDREDLDVGLKK